MISGTLLEGRDTKAINESLYLQHFMSINGLPADQTRITIENPAFIEYRNSDQRLAEIGADLESATDQVQTIDRLSPGLLDRTKTKATEHAEIEEKVAKLQSLKNNLKDLEKNYPTLRTTATNAFNSSLLNVYNAHGEQGVSEMTPIELKRQMPIIKNINKMHKEAAAIKSDIVEIHRVITEYDTMLGMPKLREKASVEAAKAPAVSGGSKPSA